MPDLSINAFRTTAEQGRIGLGKEGAHDAPRLVTSTKSFNGKVLDWVAGNILKDTNWGAGRIAAKGMEKKIAFNLFVGALKEEYGTSDVHKSNIEKAIREAVGGKVPKLNASNVAKLTDIAKNFQGAGDAKPLQRNFVVRWWESNGLVHPGHAAAGIRNRSVDDNAKDKYVSFWPGRTAGGLGEIGRALAGKSMEGSMSESTIGDNENEIAERTADRLEKSHQARQSFQTVQSRAFVFFRALEQITPESLDPALELRQATKTMTAGFKGSGPEGQMKSFMFDTIPEFESDKISLEECIAELKKGCNKCLSTLEDGARFEPKARQKRYVTVDGSGKPNPSWGLKPEKFFLPLAGQNKVKNGAEQFSFFGLHEQVMADRHDELMKNAPKADARANLLYFSEGKLEKNWSSDSTPDMLLGRAEDLRDCYAPDSEEFAKLEEIIGNHDLQTLDDAKEFLQELKDFMKQEDHALPYRMVSANDNCAGIVMDLMELGGAGAFAKKPDVGIATSPNDTADWAKKVMAEVDRLNRLASDILSELPSTDPRTPDDVLDQCSDEVRTAYQSLVDLGKLNAIPHETLMQEMKSLVEAISSGDDSARTAGAVLLKDVQKLYEKAGHPVTLD